MFTYPRDDRSLLSIMAAREAEKAATRARRERVGREVEALRARIARGEGVAYCERRLARRESVARALGVW